MARIKILVEEMDIPPADAVKAIIGQVRAFARKHEVSETNVSGVINGSSPYPHHRVRDALAAECNVDREWIDAHFPLPSKSSAAA